MKTGRHMKHTDLFLIRIWTQDADEESGNATINTEWRGKVQRVVDGEAHEFRDWEALVATLRAMLSYDLPHSHRGSHITQQSSPNIEGEEG